MLLDETGVTAAEYALILAIIGTAIALAAFALANAVGNSMTHTTTCIDNKDAC